MLEIEQVQEKNLKQRHFENVNKLDRYLVYCLWKEKKKKRVITGVKGGDLSRYQKSDNISKTSQTQRSCQNIGNF